MKKIIIAILLTTIFSGFALWILPPQVLFHHPTDVRMMVSFKNHKPEFEKIVQMINEDKYLLVVNENTARMESKDIPLPSEERLQEYRAFMNQTGIIKISSSYEKDGKVKSIRFVVSDTYWYGVNGTYKSVKTLNWQANNDLEVENVWLDFVSLPKPEFGASEGRDGVSKYFTRRVENNWYLSLYIKACSECTDGD